MFRKCLFSNSNFSNSEQLFVSSCLHMSRVSFLVLSSLTFCSDTLKAKNWRFFNFFPSSFGISISEQNFRLILWDRHRSEQKINKLSSRHFFPSFSEIREPGQVVVIAFGTRSRTRHDFVYRGCQKRARKKESFSAPPSKHVFEGNFQHDPFFHSPSRRNSSIYSQLCGQLFLRNHRRFSEKQKTKKTDLAPVFSFQFFLSRYIGSKSFFPSIQTSGRDISKK